jgi:acetyl esterase/lipase
MFRPVRTHVLRLALYTALACALIPGPAHAAGAVTVRSGVVYGHGKVRAPAAGSASLLLDVYQPARRSRAPRPVVVLVHGGGFQQGSRADAGIVRVARGLAGRGIVAVSIDYRLLGRQPVPSRRVAPLRAALPDGPRAAAIAAAADDTLSAVDYLRSHAKSLRVDVGRLGLIGSSAGAVTVDQVAYALDDHGIKAPKVRFVASLWGGILVSAPSGGVTANNLGRGEAALFAVHGDADATVPVQLDDQLVARAKAKHVRAEYHRMPGGTHGFAGSRFFTAKVVGAQTPFDRLLRFAGAELR